MKNVILFFTFLFFGFSLSAQDIITKKDGTDIQAKVIEVGESQISYKKYSNLEGPTYKLNILDILMITFENGEREMYNVGNYSSQASLPQGIMTYNSWSGKISVGGVTIENDMLDRYLSPEDLSKFKGAKTMGLVGGIVGIIGAVPFGWSIGMLITGRKPNMGMLLGGTVAFFGGISVNAIGGGRIRSVVNNYNSRFALKPEVRIGATDYGVGLAVVF